MSVINRSCTLQAQSLGRAGPNTMGRHIDGKILYTKQNRPLDRWWFKKIFDRIENERKAEQRRQFMNGSATGFETQEAACLAGRRNLEA